MTGVVLPPSVMVVGTQPHTWNTLFVRNQLNIFYGERSYILLHWVSVTFSQKKTHFCLLSLEESVA